MSITLNRRTLLAAGAAALAVAQLLLAGPGAAPGGRGRAASPTRARWASSS